GVMFDDGEGVAENNPRAADLFRQACDGDNALGCTNLATLYENGEGVAKDTGKALALYRKTLTLDPEAKLRDKAVAAIERLSAK
ncbi:tetratricopeptide repeat protein, partial [Novosphingobium sp.]|uniref:tetratricopeptide repeat protein n=1 Tax=Novosphingobium sp. TaxID=1874826 RepID=UPI0038621940